MDELLRRLVSEVRPGHHAGGNGIHGIVHWARVLENGLRLAEATGADVTVVRLFAVFHDSRRRNDHYDPEHGARGAALAGSYGAAALGISDEQLELLEYACRFHADGLTEGHITVQTCWDADRLDLPRCGIPVRPDRLCTDAAKDPALIGWARRRALDDYRSEVLKSWV